MRAELCFRCVFITMSPLVSCDVINEFLLRTYNEWALIPLQFIDWIMNQLKMKSIHNKILIYFFSFIFHCACIIFFSNHYNNFLRICVKRQTSNTTLLPKSRYFCTECWLMFAPLSNFIFRNVNLCTCILYTANLLFIVHTQSNADSLGKNKITSKNIFY